MLIPIEDTPSNGRDVLARLPAVRGSRELTVKDIGSLLRRRRNTIGGTMLMAFVAAVLLCIFSTRRYESSGQLQVQKDSTDALGLQSMMMGSEESSDALDANITIQTQASVLQSDTLALRVIEDLHLETTSDFQPRFNPIGWVLGLLSPAGIADPSHGTLDNSPSRRARALRVFSKNLKVKPVSGTRLIEISYLSPDPKVAAAVVNHLAQSLADYNFQTHYNATSQAADWLSGQLADLRRQSADLQKKVVSLQRQSGVFTLGEVDAQGREQVYSTVLDKLEQSTTQLAQAESNRVLKGALYQVVKSGNAEMISGLTANSTLAGAASPVTTSSLALIQGLRSEESAMQARISELSAKFGPAYPKLAELHGNLEAVQRSISDEVQRVSLRVRNDYEVAQRVENTSRAMYDEQKKRAEELNNRTIEYAIARQEAVESRTLYQNLLNKLKEAGVLAGLRSSNISLIDRARESSKPSKPNVLLYLAGSLFGGFLLGTGAAFLKDSTDTKIHDLPELEAFLGNTPLGILPLHKDTARRIDNRIQSTTLPLPGGSRYESGAFFGGDATKNRTAFEFPAFTQSRSPYIEALRALRTSLMLSQGGAPPQVILVTSSVASEGKSMLSVNLAALLAQQGKKVLLVDGDLRRPVLHRRLNVPAELGLSDILTGQGIEDSALTAPAPVEQVPGLMLLRAGRIPPYPAELLGSEQMATALSAWRTAFDFIVIDGAPVLPVTDSVVLSLQADMTLLVARHNVTERQSLERSYCRLQEGKNGKFKIGVVLNGVDRGTSSYHEYYGYSDSQYLSYDKEPAKLHA